MKLSKCKRGKNAFSIVFIIFTLFILMAIQARSEEDKVKYKDLEKEEITEEAGELLNEYYGDILGYIGKPDFKTIATKGNIAILNVTIDGKDRRILTRLKSGIVFPSLENIINAELITTSNLVVLGNISLRGIEYSEIENTFGVRRFFGLGSTTLKYVDEGFARLINGNANISINPILSELIDGYTVFLSAEGITRGIYVSEKTNSYFVVKSLNPSGNVAFSWMLRGMRKGFDEYLDSKEKIKIIATINFENKSTEIKIFGLLDYKNNQSTYSNQSVDDNQSNYTLINSTTLITGNVVLEGNISKILEEQLTNDIFDNETLEPELNDSVEDVLEFTLSDIDESYIIDQAAFVSGLGLEEVKKFIKFVYKEPENFEDEVIEPLIEPLKKIEGIEKINGSVKIRLG